MTHTIIETLDEQLKDRGVDCAASSKPNGVPDYHYSNREYWFVDSTGTYNRMDETGLSRRLEAMGMGAKSDDGLSEVDQAIIRIQDEHSVAYAGLVAGYSAGLHWVGDSRVLVTRTTNPVEAKEGDWPVLHALLKGMLVGDDFNQYPYFLGWLKTFLLSYLLRLQNGSEIKGLMPGQALVLAGPPNCGKSLLISLIVAMFGGRSSKPWSYMMGRTNFNSETAAAPVLVIDDEAASKDPRDRNQFAQRIKEFTVGGPRCIHGKYREPVVLEPCQRLIVALNCEHESMLVLPNIDSGIADKLMLLEVHKAEMPMKTETFIERQVFMDTLLSELPAFVYFLRNEFEIPHDMVCGRYGVKHFHHPDILEALKDLSPDTRLLEIIDKLFATDLFSTEVALGNQIRAARTTPWTGTATEFEAIVRTQCDHWETARFFRYLNSAGMILRSLASSYPRRVERGKYIHGNLRWTINPPVAA